MDAANLIVELYYEVKDLKEKLALAEARLEQSQTIITSMSQEVMRLQEAPFEVTMTLADNTLKKFTGAEAEQIMGDALEFYGPTWQSKNLPDGSWSSE